jgi:hypothetical protein
MSGDLSAFFSDLKKWKNIESQFDISGFTKRPEETEPEAASSYQSPH